MSAFQKLSILAIQNVTTSATAAVGAGAIGQAVAGFLQTRLTDHSTKLTAALRTATERAWTALELALAGDSFWNRCKAALTRGEDRAFRDQVRVFLDTTSLPTANRRECLEELRAARKAGVMSGEQRPDVTALGRDAGNLARFSNQADRLTAEWKLIDGMAGELRADYPTLAKLIAARPADGMPLLVVAVRYFFRREVESDEELFRGLALDRAEQAAEAQAAGFESLHAALATHAERLHDLLADVQAVVVETHGAVLDLKEQMQGQGEEIQKIGAAVQKLLDQHQLSRRAVRPGDSMSVRNDAEREVVRQVVARYRTLPESDRRRLPALLNAVGKLGVVAGEFDAAQRDFQTVSKLVDDTAAQAEAHYNAYQTALEQRDKDTALREFIQAVKLDGKRFAPFPVGKYHPVRILGAGGFGVAFLCKHKYMDAQIVVKSLRLDDLGRDAETVFSEAQLLRQLDHPAVIRMSDCGYVDSANKDRPFLVMDYFEGGTLEEYVGRHGPLPFEDMLAVARRTAEGLAAAHGKGILHRDVKPANLLVRKDATGWQVKLIDFGLAMQQKVVKTSGSTNTSRHSKTLVGGSIAGTMDYAAPEQMGKRDEPVGPHSDVYGFAKTCCFGLFQTTQPLMKHWSSIPTPLTELLEGCLEEDPKRRVGTFTAVLAALNALNAATSAPSENQSFASMERDEGDTRPSSRRKASRSSQTDDKRSALPWIIGGVLAILLVGVVVAVASRGSRVKPEVADNSPKTNAPETPTKTKGSTSVPAKKDETPPKKEETPKKDEPKKEEETPPKKDDTEVPKTDPKPPIGKNNEDWKTKFPVGTYEGNHSGIAKATVELKADGTYHRVLNGNPLQGRFEFSDGKLIFSGGTGGGFIEVWSIDGDIIRLKLWYPANRYPDFPPNETGEMKRVTPPMKEANKDEPFVLPKNWEAKFNTGKTKPTYDPKTGILKLTYDFSDNKQLKDFEYDKDIPPKINMNVLTMVTGTELKHAVAFTTLDLSCQINNGGGHQPLMRTSGGSMLRSWLTPPAQSRMMLNEGEKELVVGNPELPVDANTFVLVKSWSITDKLISLKAGNADISAKRPGTSTAVGHIILVAKVGPNRYSKLTLSGKIDPDWAKEFFADK